MLPSMHPADPPAVIFDMDGVLVDSYAAHFESWRAVCREDGIELGEARFARSFGRTSAAVIDELWQGRVSGAAAAALDARKEALYRELIDGRFPEVDGARELIDALGEDGFRLAVGSSGPPENVALVLARLGCRARFAAVVTGKDVARGKPDPQIFLTAAARLGAAPARCVVIEDAPVGIEAARAAGMATIGFVASGRTAAELAAADLVVARLGELTPARVRALLERRERS
jgi:beta-phosphoglucomutase